MAFFSIKYGLVIFVFNVGLETVVSVLFTNTCTRFPYNELRLSILHETGLNAELKILSSLYGKQLKSL